MPYSLIGENASPFRSFTFNVHPVKPLTKYAGNDPRGFFGRKSNGARPVYCDHCCTRLLPRLRRDLVRSSCIPSSPREQPMGGTGSSSWFGVVCTPLRNVAAGAHPQCSQQRARLRLPDLVPGAERLVQPFQSAASARNCGPMRKNQHPRRCAPTLRCLYANDPHQRDRHGTRPPRMCFPPARGLDPISTCQVLTGNLVHTHYVLADSNTSQRLLFAHPNRPHLSSAWGRR